MRSVCLRWAGGLAVGTALAAYASADQLQEADALAFLQKISGAARQLNYEGVFVYQHGEMVETSSIVHLVEGTAEHEKLATLDGPKREVIRNNDEVSSYYPEIRTMRIEKRAAKRTFPALPSELLSTIVEHYTVRRHVGERIAGFDTESVSLEPRDNLRYGHKFWSEIGSGLLLKARMVDGQNHTIEMFTFTQVKIGGKIPLSAVQASYAAEHDKWKVERLTNNDTKDGDGGWVMKNQPAGFRKVYEMRRPRPGGGPQLLTHIVLTDGLAAVSVFIEPSSASKKMMPDGLTQHGAINIYTKTVGEQRVTVLGETPAATVTQIAGSLTPKGR
jgi:sigma-E factor negative regulatory protein RseB